MSLDYIVEICVAIDIAILGIAYPIIVDKISNIGDKYSSHYIAMLFNNDFPQRNLTFRFARRSLDISVLKLTLFITISTFLLLIFNSEPWFGLDFWLLNNSSKLIVLLATTILTVFFFIWLDKVVLYNGKSTSLLTYIISKYNNVKNDVEIKAYFLKSINELSYYAIDKQDEHLQETLVEFYYHEFSRIRKEHNRENPLVYPIDLYFFVNKLNRQLSFTNNRKLLAIEHRAVSGIWLLGEDYEEIQISEETYRWIWANLYIICDNEKFIKMYWGNVNQYFERHLRPIQPEYSFDVGITNQSQITQRDYEMHRFLELHYALGGLLLYRNQYSAINYLLQYSQSIPPRYALLPETMTEIFNWFEHFRNEFKNRGTPIDIKYEFPGLDNLGNRRQIISWICRYISILFIRQFTLQQYYGYQDFTATPQLPKSVVELNNWLDGLLFFKRCLIFLINDTSLMKALELTSVVEGKKEEMLGYVDKLKKTIKAEIGRNKKVAELSDLKVQSFQESTNEIITNAFKEYEGIVNKHPILYDEPLSLVVKGGVTIMNKSAFTENDIAHLNYNTVFADQIAKNVIKSDIPNSFYLSKTRRYLLNNENLILGIEKVIGDSTNAIIIGVNIGDELNDIFEAQHLERIIHCIPSTTYESKNVLYILNKVDLPAIVHNELKQSEIEENHLIEINNDIHLYASVVDLSRPENLSIKRKWPKEGDEDESRVQITIAFNATLSWRKEREIVQINLASQYKEQGIQSEINDILPLAVKN